MQLRPETPTVQRTIGTKRSDGSDFSCNVDVPLHYREGDTLTAGEARQMNQTLAEHVSNNTRQELAKADTDESDGRSSQQIVDDYLGTFEFGEGGFATRLTPTERKAKELATTAVGDHFKANNLDKSSEAGKAAFKATIDEVRQDPDIIAKANVILEAEQAAAGGITVAVAS